MSEVIQGQYSTLLVGCQALFSSVALCQVAVLEPRNPRP